MEDAAATGGIKCSSFNRYLRADNTLLLYNPGGRTVESSIQARRIRPAVAAGKTLNFKPKYSVAINVNSPEYQTQADTYGVLKITPSQGGVLGGVLRSKLLGEDIDYAVFSPAR